MTTPATPLREKVLANLVSVLELVQRGDVYHTTVDHVSRSAQSPDAMPGTVTLYVWSPSELVDALEGSAVGTSTTTMLVHVEAFVRADVASDTDANLLAADIERAVCADRTRGGFAKQTVPVGRTIITDEVADGWATLQMRFEVTYRHSFTSPSTQI